MKLNRRDILEQLRITLAATPGITTVVRCYEDLDILSYTEAQLPLVEIREPAEDAERQLVGRHQIVVLKSELKVWFVSWAETPTTTYETLMKNIRNKIAESFTLSQKATGVWVTSISLIQGALPVYWFMVGLKLKYYLDEQDV